MGTADVPKSVRVRCGQGNEHRFRSIKRAADLYDCNKIDAVAYACHDIAHLAGAIR